jgi:hypothetical protein
MRGYDLQIAYGLNKKRIMLRETCASITQVMAAPDNARDF